MKRSGVMVVGLAAASLAILHPSKDSMSFPFEGARRGATGFVVAVPHRPVRLCSRPSEGELFNRGASEGEKAPSPIDPRDCEGIDVAHVDLDKLTRRKVVDGRIEGQADLQGTFADGVLHVDKQGPPRDTRAQPFNISHPPCRAPVGGWYHSSADPEGLIADPEAAVTYMASHPEAASVAIARPGSGRYLFLVLVDGDPAPPG